MNKPCHLTLCTEAEAIRLEGVRLGPERMGPALPSTSTLSRTSSRTRAVTHNILVRIRIRGSMPLTKGSGFCYFRH